MTQVRSSAGTVRINDGEPVAAQLQITRETQVIRSAGARHDPGWTFTDTSGHFHAFAADGEAPTLHSEEARLPCNGGCGLGPDCEGFTDTVWSCRICGEEIAPDMLDGEHSVLVETGSFWEISADAPWLTFAKVTVQFTGEDWAEELFGVAVPTHTDITTSLRGTEGRVLLRGIGKLSRRTVAPVAA
jgi:hypothetical protein